MKKIISKERGVSLISLTIAITIIVIVTNMLIYNAKDGTQIKKLQDLYNDISTIREKVSLYYSKYGTIPKSVEYTNVKALKEANVLGANDTEKFYVIDLNALDGVSLNYGVGFENIKEENYSKVSDIDDIYIINEGSHNIFYAAGIEVRTSDSNKVYYTDIKEPDTVKVRTKAVEGVMIPDGFYYIGGNKKDGLVISDVEDDDLDNSKQGNQFVWVPVENPDVMYGYLADDTSVGKLYEVDSSELKPLNWEEEYGTMVVNSNVHKEPAVIETNDDEESSLNIIKNILTGEQANYNDKNSFKNTMQTDFDNMIASIEEYRGFFVGRFETSLDEDGKAQSKKGQKPASAANSEANTWYGFYAREKAFAMDNQNVESSMIWGSQYDAMIRWALDGNDYVKVEDNTGSNHSGAAAMTGEYNRGKDKLNNIYDLGGNLWEWTLESAGDELKDRVSRGGSYNDGGQGTPATRSTHQDGTKSTLFALGSRMTIYIKALRPKVGDFVEYALTTPSQEKLNKLNSDIAQYSGSTGNTTKTADGDTLLCRILEVDKRGNPTRLISADGVNSLSLSGADGYNNAVYLINEMCETLYSGKQGLTRSLTIEDLENNYFSDVAIATRKDYADYINYGETYHTYAQNYCKYPNIALQEAGMGIATTLIDGKNQIQSGGLGLSEQDKIYTGSGDANTSDIEANHKGITVTQTYYNMLAGENNYKNATLNNIFHTSRSSDHVNSYWIGSRCVTVHDRNSIYFVLRYADYRAVVGYRLFSCYGTEWNPSLRVRPIILLNSGTKAKYIESYNSTYDKWELE